MMAATAPFHPTHTSGNWEDFEQRVGGTVPALLLFALCSLPLQWLDIILREQASTTVLFTPSAGLLFVVLWLSRPSRWPVLLAIHVLLALGMQLATGLPESVRAVLLAVLPVPVCSLCSAVATMVLIRVPIQIAIWQVPRAIIGGVLGGLAGTIVRQLLLGDSDPVGPTYAYDLLSHWASFGLGAVALGPTCLMWLLRIRVNVPELMLRSRRELAGITAWVLGAGIFGWVFMHEPNTTPLAMPIIAGPALVLGCFRLPPRWALTLSSIFLLEFAVLITHRTGPFSISSPEVRVSVQQLLVGIFAAVPFLLSVGITQLRIMVARQVELNARLVSDQERLRSYARQLAAAEEKARRATAVDLHDGIGQTLAGTLMIVEVARQQSAPAVQKLLDDLRVRLREIQDLTRRMISDMSPPGLYDLGLEAALQWLVAHLRAESELTVQLDCRFDERRLRLETRVLVFKLVRELLRNVVKHAGISVAQVTVDEDGDWLCVTVGDEGRGFEWQAEIAGERSGHFGLLSVADRVRDAGGSFEVQSAIGSGTRVTLRLPLAVAQRLPDFIPMRLRG